MAWRLAAIARGLMTTAIALALLPGDAPAQNAAPHASVEIAPAPREVSPTTPVADAAPGHPTPPRPPPEAPADPAGAAVYAVLEKHCARCHQAGRLERPAPAAAFGNILRLDDLAAAPWLVQPGNPDASPLYLTMLRRLMPIDVDRDTSRVWPTPDEISHLRGWISGLSRRQSCHDRQPVTARDHAATLLQLVPVTGGDPKKLRFLSIAHLHNACIGEAALDVYRQAILQTINSLSWKTTPVAVPPIDPARTLFRIDLDDLGWQPEHWDRIMRASGNALGLTPPLPADVRQLFGTEVPVARADWFASTVLTAPLYDQVLGLPNTAPEILATLQTTRTPAPSEPNAPSPHAGDAQRLRAAVTQPRFSLRPSLIERDQSPYGPVWRAFHWPVDESATAPSAANDATHADPSSARTTRAMFALPNGLTAFFMADQAGRRLDILPPDVAKPSLVGRARIQGGLGCMSCHHRGPLVDASNQSASNVAARAASDRTAISNAMRRIGIDPDVTLDGVAPVAALAHAYSRPLDAIRAAAELGIDLAALLELADRGPDPASVLARRLVQGLVARDEIEAHAESLVLALTVPSSHPAAARPSAQPNGKRPQNPDAKPPLMLYSDKARYKKGDELHITIAPAIDCHVTVISVDTRGRGTVLFPSDFAANGFVRAGRPLDLPGPAAPYKFRLNETGRETIVALCNEAGPLTDNIRYDFERQRFPELGNYATFLSQNAPLDPDKAASAVPAPSPRRRKPAMAPPEIHARPDQIFRTAISIIVE